MKSGLDNTGWTFLLRLLGFHDCSKLSKQIGITFDLSAPARTDSTDHRVTDTNSDDNGTYVVMEGQEWVSEGVSRINSPIADIIFVGSCPIKITRLQPACQSTLRGQTTDRTPCCEGQVPSQAPESQHGHPA